MVNLKKRGSKPNKLKSTTNKENKKTLEFQTFWRLYFVKKCNYVPKINRKREEKDETD